MKPKTRKQLKKRIDDLIAENGGYSRAALQSLGVAWPPSKGWKERLLREMAGLPAQKQSVRNRTKPEPQNFGNFYASWEWKAARYEALKIHGRRCQCCGWQPGDTPQGRLVVDHIKPRSRFPQLSMSVENLQVLCNDCNMGKSNVWADDFRNMDSWLSEIGRE